MRCSARVFVDIFSLVFEGKLPVLEVSMNSTSLREVSSLVVTHLLHCLCGLFLNRDLP